MDKQIRGGTLKYAVKLEGLGYDVDSGSVTFTGTFYTKSTPYDEYDSTKAIAATIDTISAAENDTIICSTTAQLCATLNPGMLHLRLVVSIPSEVYSQIIDLEIKELVVV